MPISIEETTLQIEVPAQYASQIQGILKEFIKEQTWQSGALIAKIVIPAGMCDMIYKKIGSVSSGNAKIIEVKK